MDHRFGIAADIGDDHRQPRRHALENNVGETFLARGQKSEIRGGEKRRNIRSLTEKSNTMANAACRRQRSQAQRGCRDRGRRAECANLQAAPANMGQALDKLAMSLVVNEIGDDHANQGVVVEAKRLSRLVAIGKHRRDLDAVIDQPDLGLGNALVDQLANHGARVRRSPRPSWCAGAAPAWRPAASCADSRKGCAGS